MRHLTLALAAALAGLPTLSGAHPVTLTDTGGASGIAATLIHVVTAPDHAPLVLITLAAVALLALKRQT